MRKRVITPQQNEPVCFFMWNFVFSLQFDVFPIFLLRTAIFAFFSRKAATGGGVSQPGGRPWGNCSSKQKNWKNIKLKWENKIKHEKTDWRVLLQVITQVFSINRNRYGALSILVTSISTIYVLCYWFDVELDNSRIWVGYLYGIGNLVFVQLQTTILYRLYLLSTGYLIKTLLVQHVRDPGLARHW